MGSYEDFRRQVEIDAQRRFYLLCGNARVWVEEALDRLRVDSPALAVDRVVLWASETPLPKILEELNTYPLAPDSHRLIVVRDAECIGDWSGIVEWLTSKALPKTVAVFVSAEPRFVTEVPYKAWTCLRGHGKKLHVQGKGKTNCMVCVEWKKKFSAQGRIYELSQTFSEPGKNSAIGYVQRQGTISVDAAKYLLNRVQWDLVQARAVMWKLSLFNAVITPAVIDVVTPTKPSTQFVDALEAGRRAEAATLARTIPAEDQSRIIGQLESDLWTLAKLHTVVARGLAAREVSTTGVPWVTVERLKNSAGHYHPAAVEQCRNGLMVVDNIRQRYRVSCGLLETLAALW